MKIKFPLVMCWWVDAVSSDNEDPEPIPAITVGFLIEDLPDRVTLAGELFPDGDRRAKTSIPRAMVKDVIRVRCPKPPAWVVEWVAAHQEVQPGRKGRR